MPPRISVVIAAYRPGDGFDRVMDSLDAQTLPQGEFETIVVDDGSPDDTFERLSALAATRPNMRVERIENSGWPSRPRNIATGLAQGEYVLFMDHDDSLYPDALRRMAEYASETRADLLSPKESKTSDAWWGMPALVDGNVPNALTDGGIDRLLPMVPHKLYRREFLLEQGIAFPEGRRQLWEDIYVNVAAWRKAERVAVLADTPVYLWHSSATNNSKTYGPRTEEFWDRLDELLAFIDTTLDGEAFAEARRSALLHQYRSRVLLRLSRDLTKASAEETAMAMGRARAIQERYIPEAWDAGLAKQVRARSILLRAGRVDLLAALWAVDVDTSCRVTATEVVWREGRLHLTLTARWLDRSGGPVGLIREGDRLYRALSPELRAALPDDVVEFSDTLDRFRLDVAVRDRPASVTWQLRLEQESHWIDLDDGRVAPELTATAVLDPGTVALGAPLATSVHDLVASLQWDGAQRAGSVRYSGPAAPAVLHGGTAVAYRSQKGALALDTSARLRNVIADGGVSVGLVPGALTALRLPLPRIAVFAPAELPAAAKLTSARRGGAEVLLHGALVAEAGGVHLDLAASGQVPEGEYLLTFRLGDGEFLGPRPVGVSADGLTILPRTPAAPASGLLGRVRARLVRAVRGRA
ncbi:MAG: glycosyltransferase family 2 protein [Acidobacteria bacterium]|nr:glycosyltransferase family 2 protein [Acidobacteriota bacterium]